MFGTVPSGILGKFKWEMYIHENMYIYISVVKKEKRLKLQNMKKQCLKC